jgi:hypothetical protein
MTNCRGHRRGPDILERTHSTSKERQSTASTRSEFDGIRDVGEKRIEPIGSRRALHVTVGLTRLPQMHDCRTHIVQVRLPKRCGSIVHCFDAPHTPKAHQLRKFQAPA